MRGVLQRRQLQKDNSGDKVQGTKHSMLGQLLTFSSPSVSVFPKAGDGDRKEGSVVSSSL